MKFIAYIAGLLGLALLVALVLHADMPAMLRTWQMASAQLLWVVPYRIIFFVLYAIGWRAMLKPFDPQHRVGFWYVLWGTTVREAVDRLLPVASVGGSVVGVRIIRWRGIGGVPAAGTIIVEILLTLMAVYVLGAIATMILLTSGIGKHTTVVLILALSLPIPVVSLLLLRYGSVFGRIQRFLSPLVGLSGETSAAALDTTLKEILQRVPTLLLAGGLQLLALLSAAFEIWWAARLFEHPIGAKYAVMLEGLSQAARHLAFIVPAGLGVQEGALVLFGHALGISTEIAIAISAVKRIREVLCGLPPLLWWQRAETVRFRQEKKNR